MKTEIRLHRHIPESRPVSSAIILLHGYGADGKDLIGLAKPMSEFLPNCAFVAPDAPEPCAINPGGRQWFPIPTMDGSSEISAEISLNSSVMILKSVVAKELENYNLTESSVILLGFSQGTMIALHYAARHMKSFAGVIGFSGRLLAPERLARDAVSKPPVLLVHGDADPVVPYSCLEEAGVALTKAGFMVQSLTSPGAGHGIAQDGIEAAIRFAQERLNA